MWMRRPTPSAQYPVRGPASDLRTPKGSMEGGSAREQNGSKAAAKMTAGLDLGDKYSYLCLLDDESGEVIEEGRLRTTPEAFERRFGSERSLKIAIEIG